MYFYAIKTVNLTKYYGNFPACVDINLNIPKGDVFAFIGPNGAGKTTTIKMLTGILKPTKGDILINGNNINENPLEAKKIIGYLPDRPFLYEKLTGREFLFMVKEIFKVSDKAFNSSLEYYLEYFTFKDRIDELIENYSHGMKQKIVLISALIHDPEIFIMDEPLVGLDPKSSKLLKDLIKNLSEKGKTFFISTHILSLVEEICKNVAIINRGRIIICDNIENIKNSNFKFEDFFLETIEKQT
ncbi:MAG: ABC transporter ATP-binding protein [Candidatus Woesearchaeota archaeon]